MSYSEYNLSQGRGSQQLIFEGVDSEAYLDEDNPSAALPLSQKSTSQLHSVFANMIVEEVSSYQESKFLSRLQESMNKRQQLTEFNARESNEAVSFD
jgi:hypothetical protein